MWDDIHIDNDDPLLFWKKLSDLDQIEFSRAPSLHLGRDVDHQ